MGTRVMHTIRKKISIIIYMKTNNIYEKNNYHFVSAWFFLPVFWENSHPVKNVTSSWFPFLPPFFQDEQSQHISECCILPSIGACWYFWCSVSTHHYETPICWIIYAFIRHTYTWMSKGREACTDRKNIHYNSFKCQLWDISWKFDIAAYEICSIYGIM